MSQNDLITSVIEEVLGRLGPGTPVRSAGATSAAPSGPGSVGRAAGAGSVTGLFADVEPAVENAAAAQKQLVAAGVGVRDEICKLIKQISTANAQTWGKFELEETKVGRLDHKIAKLELLANVPGVEFLKTAAHSGDDGIGLDEAAPFGVIGVVTPVTHSIPTMSANAINMIAAGNAMVVNPHPSGAKSAALAAETYNKAIYEKFKIAALINVINPPTLETAQAIFEHPRIPMLVATGGPAVARAAMQQTKRAVVAGPGNPPVVVDETADLDIAASSIISGAAFDNNLLCIGEKEVFVIESVFDKFVQAMKRAGAAQLDGRQIDTLTQKAFAWKDDHFAVQKELVGKDASVLAAAAGVQVSGSVELLFGETDESNPFVAEEQMMPFVPLVRVRDFDEGLRLALKHEHGFGHTAIIHSNNLARITRMGRAMNTTIFVANGPCTAGLGIGGEGFPSYSIATPTGEGITSPMTFTRFRRGNIAGALRFV